MKAESARSIWIIINNARNGVALDENRVLEAIDIIDSRVLQTPIESAAIGYFILGHTRQPDRAHAYFARAVQATTNPAFAKGLIEDLRKDGQSVLADQLEALPDARVAE